jgi:hypothetical protein
MFPPAAKAPESPRRTAAASRSAGAVWGLAVGLSLLSWDAGAAVGRWSAGVPVARAPWQPPEQPPEQPPAPPPEQPPAPPPEEGEGEDLQPPVDEAAGPEKEGAGATPSAEDAVSGATEGEGEVPGEGEPAEEEEDEETDELVRRAPAVVTAPAGILPGRMVATPAPVPGTPVMGMVLLDDGFLLHTVGGAVIAYDADGAFTRWGLPGAGATFVAEDAGTVVLLDDVGEVSLRRSADGVRIGGFATGFPPDQGNAGRMAGSPAPVALAGGVLYWVSARTLRGYGVPAGNLVLEVPLPDGDPMSLVVATPTAGEPGSNAPPLVLVSLGSGGVVAAGATGGASAGSVRWQVEGAGPVTGPVLAFPAERLVFIGDEGGELAAADLETGRERWRWTLAEGFHHPPLLSRGRLYAATKANSLYCFDAKRGGERWRAALPGRPAAPPLRVAGVILVVTRDGLLVELNAETGERVGSPRDLEAEVHGVVRRRDDGAREDGWRDRRLFLGLRDGRLAIFGPRVGGGES